MVEPLLLETSYGREDDCSLCVHEHENWGNNPYCNSCPCKYRN